VPEFATDVMRSLDVVLAWMEGLPALWAYLVVLGIAYGENVCPPIPGDMVVVFGGYLAGNGTLNLPAVVALATLGGALGFMTVYAVGRRFGQVVLAPGRFRWVPQEGLEKAQRWIRRWGYGVVAANRFLTGARSVISLAVGMAQMNAWKTASWATVSAAVWCTLIAYAGYALGENWRLIRQYLAEYSRGVLALLGAALLAWGAYRLWQRRRADDDESAPPEERAKAASEKP
jgi:membrane protein DedA with SNARE-associated domain